MGILDFLVRDEDYNGKDIAGLPDNPSAAGITAEQLKDFFDSIGKKILAPKLNALINALVGTDGAKNIGTTEIEGLAGYNVQDVLVAVKLLLDSKQSIEQSNIDVGQKFDASEAQDLIRSITFTEGTGVFTITKYDGSVETIDTAIEKVPLDVELDGQEFVLTLADGTEQRVNLSAFLTQTEVQSSETITMTIDSAGKITAKLTNGSVKLIHLNAEVTAYLDEKASSAANSASAAAVSAQNALNSANASEQSRLSAAECQQAACNCADRAEISEENAATSETNAKASEQAAKQSETKSATSEANAKASEEKAATSEKNASDYEQGALQNAQTAGQAAETAVNAMNNASASEQNAKASETASQTNKEASDTSASSAAESARAAAESAKRAEEEANRAADNAGGDFATRTELQAHTTAENPHNIDAETVGLGNVPNVATNDQTPTYEVSADNAELASGEKLSIAFGKIAKAVSSFISHLTNKSNPHEVTAEQSGAAKTDLSNVENTVFQEKAAEAGLGGDFLDKEVYDPQSKEQDVFQYADNAVAGLQKEVEEALNNALTNVSVNGIAPDENGNIVLTAEVLSTVLADVFAKYLPLTGGTLSGNVFVKTSTYPSIRITGTSKGRDGYIQVGGNAQLNITNRYINNENNKTNLLLYPETYKKESILFLQRVVNGETSSYMVYGTHNITAGAKEIEATTTELDNGCIYLGLL